MAEYPYKGLPITPAIIEYLIIYLLNGKTLKRDDIVNKILDHHISNGGLAPQAQDLPRSVKKALSNMQQKNHAINKSYGYWEIQKTDEPVIPDEEPKEEIMIEDIPTHTVYGNGNYAIYFYYYPSYRKLSESHGEKTWPCKIGRTDRDPLIRILSQAATALPEKPVIEFIIKNNDSSLLETMIHSILTLRGKQVKDSPGTEWFNTNPEEVIEIINFVDHQILKL